LQVRYLQAPWIKSHGTQVFSCRKFSRPFYFFLLHSLPPLPFECFNLKAASSFYVPLLAILFLYWRIYLVARKRIRRRQQVMGHIFSYQDDMFGFKSFSLFSLERINIIIFRVFLDSFSLSYFFMN